MYLIVSLANVSLCNWGTSRDKLRQKGLSADQSEGNFPTKDTHI